MATFDEAPSPGAIVGGSLQQAVATFRQLPPEIPSLLPYPARVIMSSISCRFKIQTIEAVERKTAVVSQEQEDGAKRIEVDSCDRDT
jgi:hypothetical protein